MARARRRRPPAGLPSEVAAPAELLDADHLVWRDQRAYRRYMGLRGWSMPPAERLGCSTSPGNRRRAAAAAWACLAGVAVRTYGPDKHPHPDWHQLRELGLLGGFHSWRR